MEPMIALELGAEELNACCISGMQPDRSGGQALLLASGLPNCAAMAAGTLIPCADPSEAAYEQSCVTAVHRLLNRDGRAWEMDGHAVTADDLTTAVVQHALRQANETLRETLQQESAQLALAYPVDMEPWQVRRLIHAAESAYLHDGPDAPHARVAGIIPLPAAAALQHLHATGAEHRSVLVISVERERTVVCIVHADPGGALPGKRYGRVAARLILRDMGTQALEDAAWALALEELPAGDAAWLCAPEQQGEVRRCVRRCLKELQQAPDDRTPCELLDYPLPEVLVSREKLQQQPAVQELARNLALKTAAFLEEYKDQEHQPTLALVCGVHLPLMPGELRKALPPQLAAHVEAAQGASAACLGAARYAAGPEVLNHFVNREIALCASDEARSSTSFHTLVAPGQPLPSRWVDEPLRVTCHALESAALEEDYVWLDLAVARESQPDPENPEHYEMLEPPLRLDFDRRHLEAARQRGDRGLPLTLRLTIDHLDRMSVALSLENDAAVLRSAVYQLKF